MVTGPTSIGGTATYGSIRHSSISQRRGTHGECGRIAQNLSLLEASPWKARLGFHSLRGPDPKPSVWAADAGLIPGKFE